MTLDERRFDDVTVLDVKGRLVLGHGEEVLRERVNALVAEGRRKIIVNLRDVTYIDSCGVGALIAKFISLRRQGGDLRLLNLSPRSHHVLEIARLLDVFQVFTSEAEAIRSFSTAAAPQH